jgi:hypothetical protein
MTRSALTFWQVCQMVYFFIAIFARQYLCALWLFLFECAKLFTIAAVFSLFWIATRRACSWSVLFRYALGVGRRKTQASKLKSGQRRRKCDYYRNCVRVCLIFLLLGPHLARVVGGLVAGFLTLLFFAVVYHSLWWILFQWCRWHILWYYIFNASDFELCLQPSSKTKRKETLRLRRAYDKCFRKIAKRIRRIKWKCTGSSVREFRTTSDAGSDTYIP